MSDMVKKPENDETKEVEEVLPNVTNIKTQETFVLPSKGLLYLGGSPKEITLRRMTIKEEKIRLRNDGEFKIRKDILQACTLDEVDVGKLTLFDAEYLLFCLRRISLLNNQYKVSCVCPNCSAEFIDEVDLSKLKINYIDENNMPELDIELPISRLKVKLKYPDLNSMILFLDEIREYMSNNPNESITEIMYMYGDILSIDAVNGDHLLFAELEDLVSQLDIVDIKFLKASIRKIDGIYGIDNKGILCQCPSCKKDVRHGLPITDELFSPSL